MSTLSDIYNNIKNPLDNLDTINKLISAYAKSQRHTATFSIEAGLYKKIIELNQNKDNSRIDMTDKEQFFVNKYNRWISSILSVNFNDEQMKKLGQAGIEFKQFQEYLKSVGRVNSFDDIEQLTSNPSFNEEYSWEVDGDDPNTSAWDHVKSKNINFGRENRINTKHRLYIGCQNQDIYKILNAFTQKCEAQNIPYYFKTPKFEEQRDDKIVIYADTENVANYIDILNEVGKEYPEIVSRSGQPPILTGKVNEWIGIGDEPPKDSKGNHSYNEIRAEVIDDGIEEALLESINAFKGQTVEYNGKTGNFNDLLKARVTSWIIDKKLNGAKDVDKQTKAKIKEQLGKSFGKGLNKLWAIKDKKTSSELNNFEEIFSINVDGNNIKIDTYDMDEIVKAMIPIMQQIDPKFVDNVKTKITEKCKQHGIDDTFCFQKGTKQRFETIDQQNTMKPKRETFEENVAKTQMRPSSEQLEEKKEMFASLADENVELTEEEKRMKFVNGFIQAYNDTEEEYQYETRVKDEKFNMQRVQEIIETNGLNRMLTSDLDGKWIGTPSDEDFKVQYSQKQVSAMARLLKSAELLTNNKKINPEGRNYLAEFTAIPDIEYKLKQMKNDFKDESSYMYELRQKARDNRANGTLPDFPATPAEIDESDTSWERGQGLKQEHGQSNTTTENENEKKMSNKRKIFENPVVQSEEENQQINANKRKMFEKQVDTKHGEEKYKKKIENLRASIKKEKVAKSDTNAKMDEINKRNELKRLNLRIQLGAILTAEEQQRRDMLEQEFKSKQKAKKKQQSQMQGHGMGR